MFAFSHSSMSISSYLLYGSSKNFLKVRKFHHQQWSYQKQRKLLNAYDSNNHPKKKDKKQLGMDLTYMIHIRSIWNPRSQTVVELVLEVRLVVLTVSVRLVPLPVVFA